MTEPSADQALHQEVADFFRTVRAVGSGEISDVAELDVSPRGVAAFTGAILDRLEGLPATRVCVLDMATSAVSIVSDGLRTDREPRFSPDGRWLAYLSDAGREGDFQVRLRDMESGELSDLPRPDGWVEYLRWSPDGAWLLLGVAAHGADTAGGQGGVPSVGQEDARPSWTPTVEDGGDAVKRRSVWIYSLADRRVEPVDTHGENVWEAVWCGASRIAFVASPGADEGDWYDARLMLLHLASGELGVLWTPGDQIGEVAASPSGRHVALVDAICSDRGIVAGEAVVVDVATGESRHLATRETDIAQCAWLSDDRLLLAGHRGFESVVGLCDIVSPAFTELWSSSEITTGGRYVRVAPVDADGAFLLAAESFSQAPEIGLVEAGRYRRLRSFDNGYSERMRAWLTGVDEVCWQADDGLEIQGWLLRPRGDPPYPTVVQIHGGPVWQMRPFWLGRGGAIGPLLMRGFAVFLPNVRGSTGRGRAFTATVVGDLGGIESLDHLRGLDHLVAAGLADPQRLGVTGGSHGGYMTYRLITLDHRFKAAVAVSPVSNYLTQYLVSNIPNFVRRFMGCDYTSFETYMQRSPLMQAHLSTTPVLNICGALDRCTPAVEAVQFHNAARAAGVESVLATYPEEGHGVRRFPAMIDFATRLVGWFEQRLVAANHD